MVSELVRERLRLVDTTEPDLEPFLLVGAERDDRLTGMLGGKSMVRTEWFEPPDSDIALFRVGPSKYPGSLNFDECESGADVRELLRFVCRLLVERRDGGLEDFEEDRRSGITTTGIPPLLIISRRDLLVDFVLVVPFDARLLCRLSGMRPRIW